MASLLLPNNVSLVHMYGILAMNKRACPNKQGSSTSPTNAYPHTGTHTPKFKRDPERPQVGTPIANEFFGSPGARVLLPSAVNQGAKGSKTQTQKDHKKCTRLQVLGRIWSFESTNWPCENRQVVNILQSSRFEPQALLVEKMSEFSSRILQTKYVYTHFD